MYFRIKSVFLREQLVGELGDVLLHRNFEQLFPFLQAQRPNRGAGGAQRVENADV